MERLGRALSGPGAAAHRVAVLFLDVDRFKLVNDSLGHSAGDRLLVAIADRLRATMRPEDTVARFGGDEFTVLCEDVPSDEAAELVAERLAAAVAKPVALVDGEVFVTASIGIALSGRHGDTPETLLRNADAAMYRAKEAGRARAEVFEARSHHRAVDNLRTGNALHRAIERGELQVHYQPIVSLADGDLSGFEALLRWEHPERGPIAPADFIPLAEENGLIVPLGAWTLEEACRQAARWDQATPPTTSGPSVSVNLSPRQLAEPSLPNEVARILELTGVQPGLIWLEITESTLMRDAESAVSALRALRALGVHVSVDDFGSGYSSLGYLGRFPVEALKIDRSFVQAVGRNADSTAIAAAVVNLAHSLRLSAVAEGIETPEQLAILRRLGCERGQGYLFGVARAPAAWGTDPVKSHRSVLPARRSKAGGQASRPTATR